MEENFILGGAASVFDLKSIGDSFKQMGINIKFSDCEFMKQFSRPQDKQITTWTGKAYHGEKLIPLSEYWVSQCLESNGTNCCISENALKAARDKLFFNKLMEENNFDSLKIFEDFSTAVDYVNQGNSIVVKPKGLLSGYGVQIINQCNISMLNKSFQEASNIHNRTLRLFDMKNCGAMITELLKGVEYSADVFIFKERFSIVRLAQKVVSSLNGRPCALAYKLINPCSLITDALKNWCSVLFSKNDISFGQFDFIVTDSSRIVPIDFSPRVGGGISQLMMELQNFTGINPYASAIMGHTVNVPEDKFLVQLNYLSGKDGYVENDDYKLAEGTQQIYKHKGDYVISTPSSVGSRIATVVFRGNFNEVDFGSLVIRNL